MSLSLVITDVGRAALINAANTGTLPLTISQVGVSASTAAVTHSTTALAGEIKRLATFGGKVVADDTFHVSIRDESADTYSLHAFGLYLSDGTLFGVYSQAGVILEKSAASILLLAVDVVLADISAASITFGSTEFLNPPASHTTVGVARLATSDEAKTGTDDTITITPAGLKAAIQAALLALFPPGATIDYWGTRASIPLPWRVCDGTNGTPNLLGKFRIGATADLGQTGTSYALGSTGGSATMTVTVQGTAITVDQMPSHAHPVQDFQHSHGLTQNPHAHGAHQDAHDHAVPGAIVEQTGAGNNLGGGGGQFQINPSIRTDGSQPAVYVDGAMADIGVQLAFSNIGIVAQGGGQTHTHGATTTTNLPPYVAFWPIMRTAA